MHLVIVATELRRRLTHLTPIRGTMPNSQQQMAERALMT